MKDISSAPAPGVLRHKTWGDGSEDEPATNMSAPTSESLPHASSTTAVDNISPEVPAETSSGAPFPQPDKPDQITDTVGAIAVDSWGRIACGASSGGIGMKYRGRVGPAALVGVGAAVVPVDPEDTEQTSVATVTSGTGEHMATTMAATVCAERLYQSVKKTSGGEYTPVTEDEALRAMIEKEFMGNRLHSLAFSKIR
jgi:taspase (threonine aspartase 1)